MNVVCPGGAPTPPPRRRRGRGQPSAWGDEVSRRGYYDHSPEELLIGAKLAWRNHARCIGRYSWQSLKLIDARTCDTAQDVAEACWEHLEVSSNDGRLRPVVTAFRPRRSDTDQVRILNPQLIRYAGYRSAGGGVTGDAQHVGLTQRAMALGWRGAGDAQGREDVQFALWLYTIAVGRFGGRSLCRLTSTRA